MPPLVLAVVTATENARMLEKWSGFFFFHPKQLNKAFSSSVECTQFSGQIKFGVSVNYFQNQFQYLFHVILLISAESCAITKLQNTNPHVYLSDWLTCSAPWRFHQRCRQRRGAHSGSLPWDTMRIQTPKIEVSSSPSNFSALLCAPLSDWGHTHRSSTLSCAEIICILLRNTSDGFCQVLQGDCIV